jgi:radical SAM protein with 4Fe4S-binding SPASM domain
MVSFFAPHIGVAERINPQSPLIKGATCGCIAGKAYLRISPEGLVTACPYIPANERSPSVLRTPLKEIWEKDPLFLSLRTPALSGRCSDCEYKDSCGGCRARASTANGDIMGEDPRHHLAGGGFKETPDKAAPCWSVEAQERLEKIPAFLRPMIRKGLEKYAVSKGIETITPELMAELRQKAGKP